jgi:hypothetical protein
VTDDTVKLIWEHFHKRGIEQVTIESNESGKPCRVKVGHGGNLEHVVTCDHWDNEFGRCETCVYRPSSKKNQ